mmetsp:Transcript_247/g.662  ORF Transcript_247/g.662 Transcript_247/m.662 type:complete len:256 (+) Transcript_247:423-1190(+)
MSTSISWDSTRSSRSTTSTAQAIPARRFTSRACTPRHGCVVTTPTLSFGCRPSTPPCATIPPPRRVKMPASPSSDPPPSTGSRRRTYPESSMPSFAICPCFCRKPRLANRTVSSATLFTLKTTSWSCITIGWTRRQVPSPSVFGGMEVVILTLSLSSARRIEIGGQVKRVSRNDLQYVVCDRFFCIAFLVCLCNEVPRAQLPLNFLQSLPGIYSEAHFYFSGITWYHPNAVDQGERGEGCARGGVSHRPKEAGDA